LRASGGARRLDGQRDRFERRQIELSRRAVDVDADDRAVGVDVRNEARRDLAGFGSGRPCSSM